jgi:Ca-activated chloride channel family protein
MPALSELAFQWPLALLLIALPWGLMLWVGRRTTPRPGQTNALQAAWARRTSLLVMALGLSLLVLAMARPRTQIWLPAPVDRLVILIDSSGSMRADDVSPSRIDVARQSAERLIDALPASAQISLVATAANAAVVQAATRDREALKAALARLSLQPGSALGSGIALGLSQLLPEAKMDVEALIGGVSRRQRGQDARSEPFATPETALEPGSRKDALMVVLADGDSNVGPDPKKIAEIARLWGVRIYTVGIGTATGVVLRSEGVSARVRLDEKSLREIAAISGAEYFTLSEQAALPRLYSSLSGRIGLTKKQETEVSAWFAALGMALICGAALFNVGRSGRIV